jgi:hypothetical protein
MNVLDRIGKGELHLFVSRGIIEETSIEEGECFAAEIIKYAELGRSAEKARNNKCPFMGKYDFMSKTCKRCIIRDYCQKRAELLHKEKQLHNVCSACNGSGYYDSHGSPRCESCNGTGLLVEVEHA